MFALFVALVNRVAPLQGPDLGLLDVLDGVTEGDTK